MVFDNELFAKYFQKAITREELVKQLDCLDPNYEETLLAEINDAEKTCDATRLEYLVYALQIGMSTRQMNLQIFVDSLDKLLLEMWHTQHENIVSVLQTAASEQSLDFLARAIDLNPEYLSWDDNSSFEKKCVRAIYQIGKEKARPYLEVLRKHSNIQVRELACKQIEKLKSPKPGRNEIRACFTNDTIRVYQAYNDAIADEALRLGTFGPEFKMDRMTWIKPSFLWMMYRSGWATKPNQERILAIDMKREGFDFLVKNAVLTTYQESVYGSETYWRYKLRSSDIRCQWDPERDVSGNPLEFRSIQIGISGKSLEKYVNQWIVSITDITDYVSSLREKLNAGEMIQADLPKENVYICNK